MAKDAPPPYSETAPPPGPGFVAPPQHGYPPPPHPGYAPPPTEQHTVIITHTTTTGLGPRPHGMRCPSCHADIVTTVETEPNTKTHLIALLLCMFVCWPCVCLPYCMDTCQSQKHYCPNCRAYLGSYSD
ncbi:lipopolysaccharide-induced tumor necrosis factor-alpha factor-like [Cylas formicarius]|uniref:lipopolysaccharide-induced tumor necrosis factor-alpha factor-like n=1 Tax=Cylas formicarius TaxID=197179 RepID=UPI0029583801|nr:lipopolysaccharide-induced tumor necrosis factor-alpha factor-like [Cylas formicarius]XP_060535090.1 lipopolysaccharide-induced tumor necrosis factor-alpha factor-like [Cylas formicarius]XP_060535091.1 lipopolysaccharide-induced tumor necrosis factor-alpha factor-like [Cylas formicarius]XP_060535092.1 lipopolysaccharide-induced tumor necrosis factor-alpha factor-like [Cylas formicarius]